MSRIDPDPVLVTGGSGYIASFCIAHLLNEGWSVRTTVRAAEREAGARAAIGRLADSPDSQRLTFAIADLNADRGWHEAAQGCRYVMHVASPIPAIDPRDEGDLIRPARDGALRVLRAARDTGAQRVVMTASTAAITYGRGGRHQNFTEADWSDPENRADSSAYERSKTLAERAAWDFMAREGAALELVTINPGAVLGPLLGPDHSSSIDIVKKLLDGSMPGLPRFGWPLVDVRDIAALHARAMVQPEAAGERFIGAGPFYWMADIAKVLATRLPEPIALRVPSRNLPNWLVRGSALFDKTVRNRLYELGKERPVSAEKAHRILGWSPRPSEETIIATAESLIAHGLVKS